jgi:protein-disulfide isomerase
MSSRAEAKARARARREEAERQAAHAAARRRRISMLLGVLGVAVVVVVVAVVVSQSGTSKKPTASEGAKQANSLFAGIPQSGSTLGNPDAPVTIEEYIDLQCPFCQRFSQQGLPDVVDKYVRPGKAKIVIRTLTFIGADSETAARAAVAASAQNKMFQFVENFYANQKEENSGYVTNDFLRKVAGGVTGLNVNQVLSGMNAAPVQSFIQSSQRSANRNGVDSTPTFLVGPTGGQLSKIETRTLTIDDFTDPVSEALSEAGSAK